MSDSNRHRDKCAECSQWREDCGQGQVCRACRLEADLSVATYERDTARAVAARVARLRRSTCDSDDCRSEDCREWGRLKAEYSWLEERRGDERARDAARAQRDEACWLEALLSDAIRERGEARHGLKRLYLDASGCISGARLETYRREFPWLKDTE